MSIATVLVDVARLTVSIAWAFLEQLALAAIDIGRLDVADVGDGCLCTASVVMLSDSSLIIVQVCLEQLAKKFPGSPRVDTLQGIRIEASERPDVALQYYDQLLDADPSNAVGYLCFAIRSGSLSLLAGSLEETYISPSTRWKAGGGCGSALAVFGHILQ